MNKKCRAALCPSGEVAAGEAAYPGASLCVCDPVPPEPGPKSVWRSTGLLTLTPLLPVGKQHKHEETATDEASVSAGSFSTGSSDLRSAH